MQRRCNDDALLRSNGEDAKSRFKTCLDLKAPPKVQSQKATTNLIASVTGEQQARSHRSAEPKRKYNKSLRY